jgi:hypothetical protein
LTCIATLTVLLTSAAAQAAGSAEEFYSQGVHAYFAGRVGEAESLLSEAIISDADNPLPYYFRALALLRMGCHAEACGDMHVGAQLEARAVGRYAIGSALQRVQGSHRLLLEKYRRSARATAGSVYADSRSVGRAYDSDSAVLREQIVIPLDELLRPGGPQPISAEQAGPGPAESRAGAASTTPNAEAPVPPAQAEADPFGDDAQPAAAPAPPAKQTPADTEVQPEGAAEEPAEMEPDTENGSQEEDPFKDF